MENPRKTIICLATSPHGGIVASEGLRFARLLEERPIFLNVGTDVADRRAVLLRLIHDAAGNDFVEEDLLIHPGEPYEVIRAAAEESRAEMIILGALHRDSGWARVWGSVARKIARRAPCSVLLLSSGSSSRGVRRIVAGIAADSGAGQAMPLILRVARHGQCDSIHFVREFSPQLASDDEPSQNSVGEEEQRLGRQRAEQRQLADFLSAYDLGGLDVRIAALPGREGMQVVDYARRQHADLIILPAPPRRLTMWDRFFRHPLESVLLDLPCALLLHRSLKRDPTFVATSTPRPNR